MVGLHEDVHGHGDVGRVVVVAERESHRPHGHVGRHAHGEQRGGRSLLSCVTGRSCGCGETMGVAQHVLAERAREGNGQCVGKAGILGGVSNQFGNPVGGCVLQLVSEDVHSRFLNDQAQDHASWQAAPRPTMPATCSVPGRSLAPDRHRGARAGVGSAPDIESADALGPIALVAGDRQKVDPEPLDRDVDLADGLGSVSVGDDSQSSSSCSRSLNRHERPV